MKFGATVSSAPTSESKTENLPFDALFWHDEQVPNPNEIQLLTLPETAARLRVNRRTLERLIAAKEFPAPLKIGSRSLVPLADLNEYFARLFQQRNGRAST